ncbi:plasmid mobilization protein [Sinorhizobium fredii]|uniref:plasmid mobilization protein n=1 Tax=Rhizobium fredii TaxID=380 RepID=UPI003515FA43
MVGKRKDESVFVRISAEDKAEFEELAAQYGLTVSEAFRRAARAACGNGPVLDGAARQRFEALYAEIKAIGVNVNQAVRAMNTGRVPDDQYLREMLTGLSNSLSALGEMYVVLAAKGRARAKRAMTDG